LAGTFKKLDINIARNYRAGINTSLRALLSIFRMLLTTSVKSELIREEGGGAQGRAALVRWHPPSSQGNNNMMANPERGFRGGGGRVSLCQFFSNQPPSF